MRNDGVGAHHRGGYFGAKSMFDDLIFINFFIKSLKLS